MKQFVAMLILCSTFFAGGVRLKGQFKNGSAISIEQIINHETNEKKVLKKLELADGKLDITVKISETCQIELYGNDGKQTLITSYIYVENGAEYTLSVSTGAAMKFYVSAEKNSRINTVYSKIEKEYFTMMQRFSPDFAKVEYWKNKTAQVLSENKVKKGSYLEKLIVYLYANNQLTMPVSFAARAKDHEKVKKIINEFEKEYYSGKKENISTYFMTRSTLKRLKQKMK